jgi:hypothetical protein
MIAECDVPFHVQVNGMFSPTPEIKKLRASKIGKLFVHPTLFWADQVGPGFTVSHKSGLALVRCDSHILACDAAVLLNKHDDWGFDELADIPPARVEELRAVVKQVTQSHGRKS